MVKVNGQCEHEKWARPDRGCTQINKQQVNKITRIENIKEALDVDRMGKNRKKKKRRQKSKEQDLDTDTDTDSDSDTDLDSQEKKSKQRKQYALCLT